MRIVLFDIDGTLISAAGAGRRALERAFERVYGWRDAGREVEFAGMTDRAIVAAILEGRGLAADERAITALMSEYLDALEREVPRSPEAHVKPGIAALLAALAARPRTYVGLLTGNVRAGAAIKLRRFGLDTAFPFGAFGDDSADRNALVPFALRRVEPLAGHPVAAGPHVVVIGDTPRDVECARVHGARALAVATGPHDAAALRATLADAVFEDLSDTAAALAFIDAA